jgi:hypothetical protein
MILAHQIQEDGEGQPDAESKNSTGLKGQRQTLVCEHNVAGHVDKFSTPSMISLMERAAVQSIQDYLEEG